MTPRAVPGRFTHGSPANSWLSDRRKSLERVKAIAGAGGACAGRRHPADEPPNPNPRTRLILPAIPNPRTRLIFPNPNPRTRLNFANPNPRTRLNFANPRTRLNFANPRTRLIFL